MERQPPAQPGTPSKRLRKRPISEDEDVDPATPTKKPRTQRISPSTPKTPRILKALRTLSKTAVKKAEAAQRAAQRQQWKEAWTEWVAESAWIKDESYRQKVGSVEIHRTDAKTYYRLTTEELNTLPYREFENEHNPAQPGRSYAHEGVKMLVSRKYATLAGLHDSGLTERELLRRGGKLFDEAKADGLRKNPNTPGRPKIGKIVRIKKYNDSPARTERRPPGSWETPVRANGKLVGYWLNLQFDPEADADVHLTDADRFRPLDSNVYDRQRNASVDNPILQH
ncbi:Uu.00g010500.m01.CDS01 [Anthostomella pinea]|uniref:Uu.00g010500.m01.CDS01 n=1 Tax=Anthostomella pinea TaxID=933095 RepID=A0AAI8VXK6_9PEZI|nr:Uu.00g010500.m01.CDS01 [Anthostomella pinea]